MENKQIEAKQLYWEIEEIARIKGNKYYIIGDPAVYRFEPGTTEVPNEITVNYDGEKDVADIKLKISGDGFLKKLARELNSAKPYITRLNDEQSREWIKYGMQIGDFSKIYINFANALDLLLEKNRYYLPSLIEAKFESEDNDEHYISFDNGQVYIPGYVCHGAEFGVQIAGYYLADFESPDEMLDYSRGLVKMEKNLKKNKFDFTRENERGYFDYRIKERATSKETIREDLEKVIEIVSR